MVRVLPDLLGLLARLEIPAQRGQSARLLRLRGLRGIPDILVISVQLARVPLGQPGWKARQAIPARLDLRVQPQR